MLGLKGYFFYIYFYNQTNISIRWPTHITVSHPRSVSVVSLSTRYHWQIHCIMCSTVCALVITLQLWNVSDYYLCMLKYPYFLQLISVICALFRYVLLSVFTFCMLFVSVSVACEAFLTVSSVRARCSYFTNLISTVQNNSTQCNTFIYIASNHNRII